MKVYLRELRNTMNHMYRKIIKLIWWVILILVAKVKRFDQRKEKGEKKSED